MKLQSLAIHLSLAIGALASLDGICADDCTLAQLTQFKGNASLDNDVLAACPSFQVAGANAIHLTKPDTFTDVSLAALAPCGADTCREALSSFIGFTPDCEMFGVNLKDPLRATLQLCDALHTGIVTVDEALAIVGPVAAQTRAGVGAMREAAAAVFSHGSP